MKESIMEVIEVKSPNAIPQDLRWELFKLNFIMQYHVRDVKIFSIWLWIYQSFENMSVQHSQARSCDIYKHSALTFREKFHTYNLIYIKRCFVLYFSSFMHVNLRINKKKMCTKITIVKSLIEKNCHFS